MGYLASWLLLVTLVAPSCISNLILDAPGQRGSHGGSAGLRPARVISGCTRNHQAIVQPRLYDCLMVTQITLNTEPHGFDSCQGHSYEKFATNRGTFVVPGQA